METVGKILELYYTLTTSEQADLLVKLQTVSDKEEIQHASVSNCPHCKSENFYKNGSVKGLIRYKCKSCTRTFGEFSKTTFGNIIKMDKFLLFKKIMLTEGALPLKMMCKRVGISIQTSFDWRHKLIGSLTNSDKTFINETQLDDIWMNYSQKGRKGLKYSRKRGGIKKSGDNNFIVKVLTATNESQTVMKVARIGRITKSDIERNLGDQFSSQTKLVSDAHPSIIGYAKDNQIKHVHFKAKDHVAQTGENVQFLNSQASRFDTMLNRVLKGVSTKYLQNYSNWFSFMETNKRKDANKIATGIILKDKLGWDRFSNIETSYKHFISNFSVRTYRCPVLREWKANNWNDLCLLTYTNNL
jgi:transposase-like protein